MKSHLQELRSSDETMSLDTSCWPSSEKRKLGDAEVESHDIQNLAENCRRAVAPRTEARDPDTDRPVEFYPLPPELNQAVLHSLGVGGSKDAGKMTHVSPLPHHSLTSFTTQSSHIPISGLMQPASAGAQMLETSSNPSSKGDMMEDESPSSAKSHGLHCQSIPQLSVRNFNGTASQLWALCPDCGAFSQVREDKPVVNDCNHELSHLQAIASITTHKTISVASSSLSPLKKHAHYLSFPPLVTSYR